jgi:hypothetical protein
MNNTRKKPAVIFLSIIGIILAVILAVYIILYFISNNNRPNTIGDVFLYEPDYSAEIMKEESYLVLDRSVNYSDGIGSWPISDANGINTQNEVQLFLIDYISDLVEGDADNIRAKYSDEVLKVLDFPNRFTQQRVYDIMFTELSKKEINEGNKSYFRYEFKAEYKIKRNDGTFRRDLASDSVKGQYLTIDHRDDSIKITKVVDYAVK